MRYPETSTVSNCQLTFSRQMPILEGLMLSWRPVSRYSYFSYYYFGYTRGGSGRMHRVDSQE